MQLDLPHISPSDAVKTFDEERGTRTFVHRAPISLAACSHIVHVFTVDAQTARVACVKLISLMQRRISNFRDPCPRKIFATNRFPTCLATCISTSPNSPSLIAWSISMQPHSLAVII